MHSTREIMLTAYMKGLITTHDMVLWMYISERETVAFPITTLAQILNLSRTYVSTSLKKLRSFNIIKRESIPNEKWFAYTINAPTEWNLETESLDKLTKDTVKQINRSSVFRTSASKTAKKISKNSTRSSVFRTSASQQKLEISKNSTRSSVFRTSDLKKQAPEHTRSSVFRTSVCRDLKNLTKPTIRSSVFRTSVSLIYNSIIYNRIYYSSIIPIYFKSIISIHEEYMYNTCIIPEFYMYNTCSLKGRERDSKGKQVLPTEEKSLSTVKSKKDVPIEKVPYTRVAEVYADECWKDIHAVLLTHFGRKEILPGKGLTKAGRYRKLRTMFLDDEFDFESYCEFYKAKGKGFTYGLFLYPTMRIEFENTYEQTATYLRTTSKGKEKKRKEAEESKAFIRDLLGVDDEE